MDSNSKTHKFIHLLAWSNRLRFTYYSLVKNVFISLWCDEDFSRYLWISHSIYTEEANRNSNLISISDLKSIFNQIVKLFKKNKKKERGNLLKKKNSKNSKWFLFFFFFSCLSLFSFNIRDKKNLQLFRKLNKTHWIFKSLLRWKRR